MLAKNCVQILVKTNHNEDLKAESLSSGRTIKENETMKSIFKRSSSKNMLDSEETGSAVQAAVAANKSFDEQDTDQQDQGTKSISRQFSQDGRGMMYLDPFFQMRN